MVPITRSSQRDDYTEAFSKRKKNSHILPGEFVGPPIASGWCSRPIGPRLSMRREVHPGACPAQGSSGAARGSLKNAPDMSPRDRHVHPAGMTGNPTGRVGRVGRAQEDRRGVECTVHRESHILHLQSPSTHRRKFVLAATTRR